MKKLLASLLLVVCVVAVAFAAYTKFTNVQVTGELKVDGATTMTGAVAAGVISSSSRIASPYAVLTSTYNVAVATPSYVGQLALNGSYVLYVASGTSNPTQWIKVGGQ